MDYLIRERQDSDVPTCLELAALVKRTDGYPPLGPVDVEHFLSPPYELSAWVAEDNSTIVGHAALHSTGLPVTIERALAHTGLSQRRLGVIARMFVAPESRRSGVARSLLETAVVRAHERGLWPVLDTAAHFDAAIELYESAGFERVGEVTFVLPDVPPHEGYVFIGPKPPRADGLR
jgi:ribosomal protein S18 acetylase RimI-like enzyme